MVPFDWSVLDRLGSIWRTYVARGTRIAPEEHSVTLLVPTTASGAFSALQTMTFPMEGQFVWYGTEAVTVTAAGAVVIQNDGTIYDLQPQAQMIRFRTGQNKKTFARHRITATATQFEGFAPVASICGTGQRPFILPFPVFFNPSDYLEIAFFNGGAVSVGLQLTLLGWKLTV